MKEMRKITFGKYKGQYIIELIPEHIGYIMWCLNNLKTFRLTDEEQILYDAVAISLLRIKKPMQFPIENLKPFIKDKDSLEKLNSPFVCFKDNNKFGFDYLKADDELRKVVKKYEDILKKKNMKLLYISDSIHISEPALFNSTTPEEMIVETFEYLDIKH